MSEWKDVNQELPNKNCIVKVLLDCKDQFQEYQIEEECKFDCKKKLFIDNVLKKAGIGNYDKEHRVEYYTDSPYIDTMVRCYMQIIKWTYKNDR